MTAIEGPRQAKPAPRNQKRLRLEKRGFKAQMQEMSDDDDTLVAEQSVSEGRPPGMLTNWSCDAGSAREAERCESALSSQKTKVN